MAMPSIKKDFAVGRPEPEQTLSDIPIRSVGLMGYQSMS